MTSVSAIWSQVVGKMWTDCSFTQAPPEI